MEDIASLTLCFTFAVINGVQIYLHIPFYTPSA